MALYISLTRCIIHCMKRNISTSTTCFRNINGKVLALDVDSLDNFTTQLLQKKVEKWSAQKPPNISLDVPLEDDPETNILPLTLGKINNLFQEAIDINNNSQILELIEQCLSQKICPSVSNLLYALEICSQTGDIDTIRNIQKLCKDVCPEVLNMNSDFKHFVAEGYWNKGNINEALILFKEVYKDNTYLRRRVRLMLKNLIADIVTSRSEAVLVNVRKFAEDLVTEHKDFYALACIWQQCFLSEWFSDQCLALDLLNKHNDLFKTVINRLPYVVAVSLQNHRTEIVYRLLEVLLKFKMNEQYSGVLLALLDYQIHQKDLRRCIEIIRWSEQNDIQLLPIHHQKYLKLLVNYKDDIEDTSKKPKPIKLVRTKTHFKF